MICLIEWCEDDASGHPFNVFQKFQKALNGSGAGISIAAEDISRREGAIHGTIVDTRG
jgi:hypothetical protein